ncbi:KpsF/GutQ family sugar-phosphate isomerase [Christensenella intestinihominis]|uniref:KpsF/GutQ family sugar-phosphate isomerase n=1 Tax=Christensenella intestinihominis TaxID=1851429 RepID=UPI000836D279|nr:SIS domain-containing protein [Christensenella intestinihominis]
MAKYDQSYEEVLRIERDTLDSLLTTVDRDVLDRIVDLLRTVKPNSKKVITAGCGTSGMAAQKIAHTLSVVEVPSFFLSPANSIHGGMGAIQKGDVVVLFTKGGNTGEIVNYIPVCREKGAVIIGVTEDENSILGKNCDILLKIVVEREPCPWKLIASGSIVATIAVWDAIAFTVMRHNGFTKEQFYLTHPGGSVGDKLRAGK